MVEGYEWVFYICIASMGLGGLGVLHEFYVIFAERRARRAGSRDRRHVPRPPERV